LLQATHTAELFALLAISRYVTLGCLVDVAASQNGRISVENPRRGLTPSTVLLEMVGISMHVHFETPCT